MLDQEQIEARALVLEMKQAEIPTRLEEGMEDAYYRIELYDAHLPTTQEAAESLAKLATAAAAAGAEVAHQTPRSGDA